jgi:hypothetical protein
MSDGRTAKTSGTLKATSLKLTPKGAPRDARSGSTQSSTIFAVRTPRKVMPRWEGTRQTDRHVRNARNTTSIRTKLQGENMPVDESGFVAGRWSCPSWFPTQRDASLVLIPWPSRQTGEHRRRKLNNSQLAGPTWPGDVGHLGAFRPEVGNDANIQNLSSDADRVGWNAARKSA